MRCIYCTYTKYDMFELTLHFYIVVLLRVSFLWHRGLEQNTNSTSVRPFITKYAYVKMYILRQILCVYLNHSSDLSKPIVSAVVRLTQFNLRLRQLNTIGHLERFFFRSDTRS